MVVEGEVRMGGQERHGFEGATCEEHFYLECNAALAVPSESDEPLGPIEIVSSRAGRA